MDSQKLRRIHSSLYTDTFSETFVGAMVYLQVKYMQHEIDQTNIDLQSTNCTPIISQICTNFCHCHNVVECDMWVECSHKESGQAKLLHQIEITTVINW